MGEEEATMREKLIEAMRAAIVEQRRHLHKAWNDKGLSSDSLPPIPAEFVATAALDAALDMLETPSEEMRKAGEAEMMARHTNLDCFRDPYVDSTWSAMLATLRSPKI